jgi:dienelactone hydrolase
MNESTLSAAGINTASSSPVISVSPVVLVAPGREHPLEVRVSAPVIGHDLPVIIFSHGFASSGDGYAPLVNYWAAHGFVVIQPTFLDSRKLSIDPKAEHAEAVKAFLMDPRKSMMWRYRVADVKRVLDQLDLIEASFPGLKGRLDRTRIVAAGHSFGAQTTAMLLGAKVLRDEGHGGEVSFDSRIRAGVLLSAGGRGGDALSSFAKEHFSYLDQSYEDMKTPTLVVAGDQDRSPLTVLGPEWFTDAYYLSPGAESLVTLFGGEHMLGGITGFLVRETTDENPDRVAAVQQVTLAYLRSTLYPEDTAWAEVCSEWSNNANPPGQIIVK